MAQKHQTFWPVGNLTQISCLQLTNGLTAHCSGKNFSFVSCTVPATVISTKAEKNCEEFSSQHDSWHNGCCIFMLCCCLVCVSVMSHQDAGVEVNLPAHVGLLVSQFCLAGFEGHPHPTASPEQDLHCRFAELCRFAEFWLLPNSGCC